MLTQDLVACFSLPLSHHPRGTEMVGPLDVEMLAPHDPNPEKKLIVISLISFCFQKIFGQF